MTKSDRHKKLRKREKAKTQLTGVKKLARPQNVIEPTFRAKKILIRGQLQGHEDGEVVQSSRNRSLQDILHSLNHHNTNIKKDAINGLQEIIASAPDTLYSNLDKIIEKIGSLTSDIESSIRKDNLHLAENIFAQLSEDQIKPFWNLLLTYIKCTLTNLNPGVRQGCLPFITLLLSYFPNLVSSSLQTLLPSVLGLISTVGKISSSVSGGPTDAKTSKTLNLDISVKQERVKVLQFLGSCLDLHNTRMGRNHAMMNVSDSKSMKTSFIWSEQSPGLYYSFGYKGSTPNYFSTAVSNVIGSNGDEASDTEFWPNFVESCLPLINQTWLEVRPSIGDGKNDRSSRSGKQMKITGKEDKSRGLCNLQSSGVEVLESVVSVMSRLVLGSLSSVDDSWSSTQDHTSNILRRLRKNQGQDLKKYFFAWIPFSAVVESQRNTLTHLNLQLFHIAAQLRLVDTEIMQRLEHYLQVLMKKSALDSMQISMILDFLPLIRLAATDELTTKILLYALESGYSDSVYGFLGRILQLGTKCSEKENAILNSMNWELIVNKLLDKSSTLTSSVVEILTLIGIRKLLVLNSILFKRKKAIKDYLANNANGTEAEDKIMRLLTFTDSMQILEDFNFNSNSNEEEEEQEEEAELITISDSDLEEPMTLEVVS